MRSARSPLETSCISQNLTCGGTAPLLVSIYAWDIHSAGSYSHGHSRTSPQPSPPPNESQISHSPEYLVVYLSMQSSFTPSAVVFDMDGLLLDSERKSQEVLLKAAQLLDAPLTPELAIKLVGRNATSGHAYLTELFKDPVLVETFLRTTGDLYEAEFENGRIPLKSGVNELLDTLDELRIPRAIATSTKRHIAIRKLTKVNVLTRFDYIVGGDEVANGKPAPDIYLKACSFLGAPPNDCLACEDSAFGIEAAYTAGLKAILIPDLLTPTERMIGHAWKVLPSLHEVSSLVRELKGVAVTTA